MSRQRKKSERRPLVRRPLVGIEQLEAREVPAAAFSLSGTNLISFDTASPAIVQTTAISGVNASETLVGIDFRPQNGLLYGLGVNATADTGTLYAISTRTGVAGVVGTTGGISYVDAGGTPIDLPDPATIGYGFDFNPAVDRIRIVAGSLNARANPNTGTSVDGDAGNAGIQPDSLINGGSTTVDAAAYTNNTPNNGNITTQYTLDAASNSLFIQNLPNSGTQTLGQTVTLGGSTLDFTVVNGFDIPAGVNAPSSNMAVTAGSAFAVLNVGGVTGLYSINLVNAQATLIGNVSNGAVAVQGLAVQSDLGGTPAIALDAAGTSLLRFNTAAPGTVTTQALNLTAVVAGETLVGIDFRPASGQLYALGIDATTDKGTLYLVDPQTGAVGIAVMGTGSAITFATTDFPAVSAGYGLDFNPDVDRLRVTTGSGLNFRVNPDTGLPVTVTPDGAINGLGVTGVSATAYTNSFGNLVAVTATTQYTLDAASDSLYIQNAPNSGTQTNKLAITVGGTALDFTDVNGFDIPAGVRVSTGNAAVTSGFAFASLTVGTTASLYKIDLTTGNATNVGTIGSGATLLNGFTLADAPTGLVAFGSATTSISETGPTVTVMLTRTGSTVGAINVSVNVTGGTAVAGDDFVAGPYTATFADGATTAMLTIALTDDAIFEGNETIVLTIASADNAAVIGTPNVATVTITDNDPQQTFTVAAATGYALSDLGSGPVLIPFASTNPTAAGAPVVVTGVASGEKLVGIDFRPQNGLLYGLGVNATANNGTLYLISTATGVATSVGTAGAIAFVDGGGAPVDLPDPAAVNYDIDINPAVDRLRVVAGALNFRVNPNDGIPIDGAAGGLINPDGNINGATTTVNATAYTNAFPNNGGVTTQYTLDAATDKLFIQNPPNNGTQVLVAPITLGGSPLDFTAVKGFDILADVNAPASNVAVTKGTGLAVLTVGGADALYSIDLVSGVATKVGGVGTATVNSVAFQSDLGATPVVALNDTGTRLVRALSNTIANPFQVTITGVAMGETLVGIDFRPQTGQLFGLGIDAAQDKGTVYRIDPQTGAATAIGTTGQIAFVDAGGAPVDLPAASAGYGIDFNPTVDRIRVTTATGLNFRANPITGAPVDGNLNMPMTPPAGDNTDAPINGSGVTGVSAASYTNSFGQSLTGGVTTQYTLDAATDSLYIQNPPNSGTQTLPLPITLGGAPLDFTDVNGFNIGSNVRVTASNTPVASGTALAALTVGGASGLYSIDLTTGAATLLGTAPGSLSGLTTAATPAGIVEFTGATFSGSEANPTIDLTFTRTGGTAGAVTAKVILAEGTAKIVDFDSSTLTVTFADGATSAKVSVPITAETMFEADETFTAALNNATNGAVIGAISSATVTITNDDPQPTITIADAKVVEGDTGTTMLAFTVTLSNASDQTITVTADSADGTAVGGKDFTALVGGTVTFAPGTTTQTVTVDVTGEAIFESDETFTLTLSAPTNATLGTTVTGTGTITNDDAAPVLTIGDVTVTEGDTGTTMATFTVTVTGDSEVDALVQVDTTDGTATAGKDYTAIVGQVLGIPAGTASKTFTIDVTGDTVFETDETFTVTLSNPASATLGATVTGTGTITNDDTAPTVSIGNATVTEGNTGTVTATFTITLSAASEVPVTVTVDTADATAAAGKDYTAVAGTVVTFAPGVTTQTVDVVVTGDTINEANETFGVTLSAPTGATLGTATGTGTITDDDAAPTLSVGDAATSEGNTGTTAVTFTITLTGATEQTVTVSVATANNTATAGSDFTALAATTVTFAPGETTKTVTVNVTGDTTVENDETFFVVLSGATVATIADAKGFGTVVNDDSPAPASPTLLVGGPVTAIGADSGTPTVRVVDANGNQLSSSTALPAGFTGGVRTAVADVNGDGTPDIVVASGPGSVSLVRVLDGVTGKELFSKQPFESSFTGGVFVATGDVNGDGFADVVVSPDQGGGPRVDVLSGKDFTTIDSFFGIDDEAFRGGARVAVGDINGDGVGDVLVAAGFEGGPRLAAYDGKSLGTAARLKLFNDIFVFEETLRNGAFIALGDVNGDGFADVVAGGGPTGGPRVRVLSGAVLVSSKGATQTELANFFAGDPNNRTGVRVAVKDLDGDNKADIRTVVGGSNTIVTYLGKDLTPTGTPPSSSMDGIPDDAFNGGVFVG